MKELFFHDGWSTAKVALTAVCLYVAVIAILRVSGKRTLAKMSAFDFVVTVALGSMIATVVLSHAVPLVDGIVGIATLAALQWGVAFLSTRSDRFRALISAQPELLYFRGEYLHRALRKNRLSAVDVLAAVRGEGLSGMEEVEAIILETTGSLSVVPRGGSEGRGELLQPLKDPPGDRHLDA